MNSIQENLRVLDTQTFDNQLSAPWKALIVVISAVATAALGFWLAGLTGLSLGAALGTGLGFAAIHLISCCQDRPQEINQETIPSQGDLPEDSIIEGYNDELKDPDIKWVVGTRSPALALMLALFRLGKMKGLTNHRPALVRSSILRYLNITPPTREYLSGLQKEAPSFALELALRKEAPFNLQKELETARKLPGSDLGNNPLNVNFYLQALRFTISRALQYGMSDQQKNELKDHIQVNLIPIFNSINALYNHMVRFPELREYMERNRAELDNNGKLLDKEVATCESYRLEAHGLLHLIDQIQPLRFIENEQDLIDHPCPLVFASKTVPCRPLAEINPMLGRPGELIPIFSPEADPKGVFPLGEDLQIVYTTRADIERLKAILAPYGVEVRDLADLRTRNLA